MPFSDLAPDRSSLSSIRLSFGDANGSSCASTLRTRFTIRSRDSFVVKAALEKIELIDIEPFARKPVIFLHSPFRYSTVCVCSFDR